MARFCAHCIHGEEDLQLEDFDGKEVLLCLQCREADVSEYNARRRPAATSTMGIEAGIRGRSDRAGRP